MGQLYDRSFNSSLFGMHETDRVCYSEIIQLKDVFFLFNRFSRKYNQNWHFEPNLLTKTEKQSMKVQNTLSHDQKHFLTQ